jgi:(2Fe-2S) ferredoxin
MVVVLEWHIAGVSLNFLKQSVYVGVSDENLEKIFTSHFSADRLVEHVIF